MRVSVEGAEVLSDPASHDLGTLAGWGPVTENRPGFGFTGQGAPVRTVTWVARGKPGAEVTVRVVSERGGRHDRKVVLKGT